MLLALKGVAADRRICGVAWYFPARRDCAATVSFFFYFASTSCFLFFLFLLIPSFCGSRPRPTFSLCLCLLKRIFLLLGRVCAFSTRTNQLATQRGSRNSAQRRILHTFCFCLFVFFSRCAFQRRMKANCFFSFFFPLSGRLHCQTVVFVVINSLIFFLLLFSFAFHGLAAFHE